MRLIELDHGTPAPRTNGAAPVRLEIDGIGSLENTCEEMKA